MRMIGLEILFYNLKSSFKNSKPIVGVFFYSLEGTENQKFYHIKIVKRSITKMPLDFQIWVG